MLELLLSLPKPNVFNETNTFSSSFTKGEADNAHITVMSASSDCNRVVFGIKAGSSATVIYYNGTNWVNEKSLLSASTSYTRDFGESASISGDGAFLVIGHPGYTTNSTGRVYFYTRSGTVWTARTSYGEPVTPAANNRFGEAVHFTEDGSHAFFSAPGKNQSTGAVYYWLRTTATSMVYQGTYNGSSLAPGDLYGSSISTTQGATSIAILAPGRDKVHVFRYGGEQILDVPGVTADDVVKLSSDGLTLAVTCKGFSNNTGKIYVFKYTTAWTLFTEVMSPVPLENTYFGSDVVLTSDGSKLFTCGGREPNSILARNYYFDIATNIPVMVGKNYNYSDFIPHLKIVANSDFTKCVTHQAGSWVHSYAVTSIDD